MAGKRKTAKSSVQELYSDGYNIVEIAKKLKMDEIEVFNHITTGPLITTNEEREEMIALYNKGWSLSAIGKEFNKSRACVKKRLANPAKLPYHKSKTITETQLKKIKDMAIAGESLDSIVKESGVGMDSVRYRLYRSGFKKRVTYVTKQEHKKIIKLFHQGKTYTEIAKECNRSKPTIIRHLRADGLYRKKK